MTDSCVWQAPTALCTRHASFICVTRPMCSYLWKDPHIHMCDKTQQNETWLIHMYDKTQQRDMTHSHVWHVWVLSHIWMCHVLSHIWMSQWPHSTCTLDMTHTLVHMCDKMTRSYVWQDPHIHVCGRTHIFIRVTRSNSSSHDSFTCVTRPSSTCAKYHMDAMGWLRLVGSLKLYVSFAKEPYKRDYFTKETYDFKEPTNRSHSIL